MLDPGFIPLAIAGNPRSDWREYWGIRHYFLKHALNKDEYYGFLSPLFHEKTNLSAKQVNEFINNNPDSDVYTFSPYISDAACYLNVFEQGNRCHPGLIDSAKEFFDSIGVPLDFTTFTNDFRSSVYCNYIIAKPVFWDKWFNVTERLFKIAEQKKSALAIRLNEVTDYAKSRVEMKVFIIERIATLILALTPDLKVSSYDLNSMPWASVLFYPCRRELMYLNALKIAYTTSSDAIYLKHYFSLRQEVLLRCDTLYQGSPLMDFFSLNYSDAKTNSVK